MHLFKRIKFEERPDWERWWTDHERLLTPSQLLGELIDEVLLGLSSTVQEQTTVHENERHIVLFFDELDAILRLEFDTDDFFSLIRACYNRRVDDDRYRRLTFCLLGVASPSELIRDNRCTPFNIGTTITLSSFRLEEASRVLTGGLLPVVSHPNKVFSRILQWTGGQPFLTQKLCHLVATHWDEKYNTVDKIVKQWIIQDWETNDHPLHFRTIEAYLMNQGRQTLGLLECYKVILAECTRNLENESHETELLLSGLVMKSDGKFAICNRIYREIFNLDWVNRKLDETRRTLRLNERAEDVSLTILKYQDIKFFVYIGGILLGISFISLWSAYHWVTSPLWQMAFRQRNIEEFIELTRTLIYILGSFYLIGMVWKKEAYELMQSQTQIVRRWRFTFLGVGTIVFFLSVYYHCYLGPVILNSEYGDGAKTFWQQSFIPYLVYLPYTLVNYNIIALTWVAVSSYGSFKDLSRSFLRTQHLQNKLSELAVDSVQKDFQRIEFTVDREFTKFSTNFISTISRYTIFLLSICVITSFETFWGLETLADTAQDFMLVVYACSVLALIMVLWVFYHYHIAFRKVSIFLFNQHCDHSSFELRHNFQRLFGRILNSHFNLYIFLAFTFVLTALYILSLVTGK